MAFVTRSLTTHAAGLQKPCRRPPRPASTRRRPLVVAGGTVFGGTAARGRENATRLPVLSGPP
ncbi:hypothetical protein ACFOM8_02410 [Paracoccus angustae]|uniref:Uncharacterized protein n=1 Tax=Paracoccus angustae TaxID=1671480 RepID=A0ABV7U015_9RHOB